MDIYSAKDHVDKLLTYVQGVADSKPTMYKKSKDRLRDIAGTCQEVICVISKILQEEAMEEYSGELDREDHGEVFDMISTMERELSSLKKFMVYSPKSQDTLENATQSNLPKLSSECKKATMSKYAEVLSKFSATLSDNRHVQQCAKLLWRWFDTRFFKSAQTDFRYNIRRIPQWVGDIVVCYGNHVKSGDVDQFVYDFHSWCNEVLSSDAPLKFAIPYEVYVVDISDGKSNLSLSSVVLWDLLMDSGLNKLCIEDKDNLFLHESDIYNRCAEYNPEVLDNYRNYKIDSSILDECGLSEANQ